ncbi:MAG: dihydrofolate reductase [Pseudomonadota bacterium]|nr:dihydrofolate reductase [Pseudomonadota bacterium]
MPRPAISLVAAVTGNGGIGRAGALLFRVPEDLRRFKALTMGAPIIMGRKTWQSIGRPLPGRRNIVLTRDPAWRAEGAEAAGSLEDALGRCAEAARVFVIGGAEVFAQALPHADRLELTEIAAEVDADTFFPAWDRALFEETARQPQRTADALDYAFVTYNRTTQGE